MATPRQRWEKEGGGRVGGNIDRKKERRKEREGVREMEMEVVISGVFTCSSHGCLAEVSFPSRH